MNTDSIEATSVFNPLHDRASARTHVLSTMGAILIVALTLRVFHLGYLSLWTDEIFSRYYYDLFGPAYMVTRGATIEPTPALYYFLLQGWMTLFGHSEVALRSLSVAASMIALPLVYALAREVSTRSVALTAAALFAVSPMAIYFAQEARVYMITVILAALMLLGVARYLRTPRTVHLVMYGAGAVVGLYSHATQVFVIAACNLVVSAYLLWTPSPQRGRAWRGWLLANVIVGLLAMPQVILMAWIGQHATGMGWTTPFSLRDVIVSIAGLVAGVVTRPRMPGIELTGLLLIAAGAALVSAKMPRRMFAVAVGIPVAFVALVSVASLKQPILMPRILCWMTLPLCVALAYAIVMPSRARAATRVLLILTFGVGLVYQLALATDAKPPYRELFAKARPDFLRADEVVLGPEVLSLPLKYYSPGLTNLRKWSDPSVTGMGTELIALLKIPTMPVQQVLYDIKAGKAVWVVVESTDFKFLQQQVLPYVAAPERRYASMCHYTVPCLAAYGWNLGAHTLTARP
jgi:mannosyltransferase